MGAVTRTLLAIGPGGSDVGALAEKICTACVDGLDVDGAALSLLTVSPARETLWATDAVADHLEELQFSLNEGACIQAATTGFPVLVPDLTDATEATRWPLFAAAVVERTPVRALFALPLQWGTTNLGVLDLYREQRGALGTEARRDALSAADTAALLMLGLRTDPGPHAGNGRVHDAADPGAGVPEWDPSVGGRAEVHQATGMVLYQLGVTATEALAMMRARAFAEDRLLIDLARDVVARRVRFDRGPD